MLGRVQQIKGGLPISNQHSQVNFGHLLIQKLEKVLLQMRTPCKGWCFPKNTQMYMHPWHPQLLDPAGIRLKRGFLHLEDAESVRIELAWKVVLFACSQVQSGFPTALWQWDKINLGIPSFLPMEGIHSKKQINALSGQKLFIFFT